MQGMRRAIAILAGVFYIYCETGQIFQHDFSGKAGMAARPAGGNDQALMSAKGFERILKYMGTEITSLKIMSKCGSQCLWLLVDLTQHGMSECTCFHGLHPGSIRDDITV